MATIVDRPLKLEHRVPAPVSVPEEIIALKKDLPVIPDLVIQVQSLVNCIYMHREESGLLRFTSNIPEIQYSLDRDVNKNIYTDKDKIVTLMRKSIEDNRYKIQRLEYTDMETGKEGQSMFVLDTENESYSIEYDETKYAQMHLQVYILVVYYITTVYNIINK